MKLRKRYVERYVEHAKYEASVEKQMELISAPDNSVEDSCFQLSKNCEELIGEVGETYNSNPRQMSGYLLIVFELWTRLDTKAIEGCPLLIKIKPICQKCSYWGAKFNITIAIHEDYLPRDTYQRDAMLFELGMPQFLRVYRDTTWNICSTLAYPNKPDDLESPQKLVEDYGNVARMDYINWIPGCITLGSDVKTFIDTHYKWQNVKLELSRIVLPNGLNLAYCDKHGQRWLAQFDGPLTLEHLYGISVPHSLSIAVFPKESHPDTSSSGPSSHEVMANQLSCPRSVLAQEYMTLQQLLASRNSRWPLILRELKSSNLDFKKEETVLMIGHLAKQAGPASQQHGVLGYFHFELGSVELRYHEAPYMDLLLTLCIQLFELAAGDNRISAKQLMLRIRSITLEWIRTIRAELQDCRESEAAASKAKYELWAALIAEELLHRSSSNFEDVPELEEAETAAQLARKDPRGFLLEWLTFRRKGQEIQHTAIRILYLQRHIEQDHSSPVIVTACNDDVALSGEATHDPEPSDHSEDHATEESDDDSDWGLMNDREDEDHGKGMDIPSLDG
ncbi:hypothetical protein TruAng_007325 [Truncatella angustata]|nr:hypothetical protein TruAng_007325 [Truncatella angustata]